MLKITNVRMLCMSPVTAVVPAFLFGFIYYLVFLFLTFQLGTFSARFVLGQRQLMLGIPGGSLLFGSITGTIIYPCLLFLLRRKRFIAVSSGMVVSAVMLSFSGAVFVQVYILPNRVSSWSAAVYLIPVACGLLTCLFLRWLLSDRVVAGLCRKCDYDLRGNISSRCPECGRVYTLDEFYGL